MDILLAIDDDPVRAEAVRVVRDWLPDHARVVALHVGPTAAQLLPTTWPAGGGLGGYPHLITSELLDPDEVLARAREVAAAAAAVVDGEATAEQGDPADTILLVAERMGADLIVVGTGDRSWLSRLMDRSVGSTVADNASCSVLLVRQQHLEPTD